MIAPPYGRRYLVLFLNLMVAAGLVGWPAAMAGPVLLTDPFGQATATLTVGHTSGPFVIAILVGAALDARVSCDLSALPNRANATLVIVSGNNQVGQPGEALPEPLVVRLEDQFGNPIPGETATAEVIQGNAEVVSTPLPVMLQGRSEAHLPLLSGVSQSSAITDAQGEARFSLRVVDAVEGDIVTEISTAGQTVQFLTKLIERINVGNFPLALFVVDLNRDDIVDAVTVNLESDDISVLLGRGDGRFEAQQRFAVGDFPRDLDIVDLNRDGHLDIVVANRLDEDIPILLGNGDGRFAAPQHTEAGVSPVALSLGDLNRDGRTDVVTANALSNDVSVLISNQDGRFEAQRRFILQSGVRPGAAALADVNRDDLTDIVIANAFSGHISVLLGQSDAAFLQVVAP